MWSSSAIPAWENLLGADSRLACLSSQRARALHHRHGDAQPVARFQVDHSLVRKLKVYTEPAALIVDELATWPSTSKLPTSFTRLSPPATVTSAARLLRPTLRFRIGATSSTTPPSRRPFADRLVENSEIFLLGGESLRKAQKSPPLPAA